MVDSERLYHRERELEVTVEESETELENTQGKLELLQANSVRLLNVLGVSDKKANFIYAVLKLEEDPRVSNVGLHNSDILTAEVYLKRQFRDIDSLRSFLDKKGIYGRTILHEGNNYQLYQPELGVAVHFSKK